MTWHCDTHGEVIPQATGTSYRCPMCTARVVWDEGAERLREEIKRLQRDNDDLRQEVAAWRGA